MNFTKITLMSAVALASIAVLPSVAGDNGPKMHKLMSADSNKDGVISKTEFLAKADGRMKIGKKGLSFKEFTKRHEEMKAQKQQERQKAHFEKFDTNKDGKISQTEFDAQMVKMFEKKDRNNDGVITLADKRDKHDRKRKMHKMKRDMHDQKNHTDFKKRKMMHMGLDDNNDGAVSRDEFLSHRGEKINVGSRGATFKEFTKLKEKAREKSRAEAKLKREKAHFDKLDTDKNGKVTKAELDAQILKRFERMDTNGDGVINKEDHVRKWKMQRNRKDMMNR